MRASDLDPKLREGVNLRVAALCDSAYERMRHLDEAGKAGWTAREVAAIETGDHAALPTAFIPVLAFIDACLAGPRIPDEIFGVVAALLSPRDVATLLVLVGHYRTVARFIATLGIELDPAPFSWDKEH